MMRVLRERFWEFAALFAVTLLAVVIASEYRYRHPAEPEQCALCGREYVCRAPALLNLSTGEIAEMEIYAVSMLSPNGVDKTRTGFMQLSTAAGVQVCKDGGRSASVFLPDRLEPMDYALYCRNCRALLSEAGRRGYVIADFHDPDTIAVYSARVGTECFINGYKATVAKKMITAIPEGQVEVTEVLVTASSRADVRE